MSSSAQDHDASSGIKAAFTSMIQDLEDTQITKKDRTTTAGGISIADFKREAALRRFVNHSLPRGMTEFSTMVKGVFTQYAWNPKAISNVSRVSDVTDTVLDLVEKNDADSADLVLKLSYLQSQSRIYSKDELDTMQGTLSQALRTYPEHSSVWIPGIQTLARAKRMSSALSTALRIKDSMAEFNCKLVMELAELESLPEETIMDQEGYEGETRVAVEAALLRRRAEAAALKDEEEVSVDDLLSALTVTTDV